MKVVAFLQNMWVREPHSVLSGIARHGEAYRVRAIRTFLFRGCLTGRRLKAAFGNELLAEIHFDETTREIADNPRKIFPAQPEHIQSVLKDYPPVAVLAFGRIAQRALRDIWTGKLIALPHPAARQSNTNQRLRAGAAELREFLAECSTSQNT